MEQLRRFIKNLVLSAMILSLGHVLPFVTGQIPEIGSMLLPMHIPVLLCGLICGWQHGTIVGFVLPLLRYLLFGMPPIFPTGLAMSFELAAYGFLAGFLYQHSRWHCVISLYRCLIAAMVGGRVVWGLVTTVLFGLSGKVFTFGLFLTNAFLTAVPGIILQLIFIPAMMVALDRAGMVRFHKKKHPAAKPHKN